jgi:hypothetical protein
MKIVQLILRQLSHDDDDAGQGNLEDRRLAGELAGHHVRRNM